MTQNIHFDFTGTPILSIDGFDLHLRENSDFWRLHLDYCQSGMNNELGVYSHQQPAPTVLRRENVLTILYNSLVAEDGSVHDISLELQITACGGALHFAASMTNHSSARINELQYPLFEFTRINADFSDDQLVVPQGLGRILPNPHELTRKSHSEYMAADHKNIWSTWQYPKPLSMPWIGLQSGDKLLYLGWHSDKWRQFSALTGCEPRGSQEEYLICTLSSYPAVYPGETVRYDGFVLAGFDGDWHQACNFYRAWADSSWNQPVNRQEGFKSINGWQRIILKHQYGEIFHTYDELPAMYRAGAACGLNMILLFGWWQEGMDNGYPNYQPDPALGGAEKLKRAIEEINALGGIVILYANGHLIDVSTDYYKTEGIHHTMKDIELNVYQEFYRFSNNASILRSGHKTFATGCYGAKAWRDKLVEIEQRHLALGSNGTFFDQIGSNFRFCFDRTHDHANRIDEDPQLRLDAVKHMRSLLGENEYFGTEHTIDRLAMQMDFIHGCGFAQSFSEDAFPALFRYTYPDILISNRFVHDDKPGWKRALNYTFINGLIFDVGIYRCREYIAAIPAYGDYIRHLTGLRSQYRDFFTDGQYDLPRMELPPQIKAVQYTLGGRVLLTVWNDSDESTDFCGRVLPPQGVDAFILPNP
ncbi:MAG: hypothetical protein E7463_00745 [Ruminococcaceae bacterium]|nr:hypothetical protein [Oscillospiraceae bacterium]